MKVTSKARIKNILKKHCIMKNAQFYVPVKNGFGDVEDMEKYGEFEVYLSQLLHRYNPYIELRTDDDNSVHRRRTPMAILPYDAPIAVNEGDMVIIDGNKYNITYCEDVKGYYYLLSLTVRE